MKIIEVLLAREEDGLVAGTRLIRPDDDAAELVRTGHARIVDDAPAVIDVVPLAEPVADASLDEVRALDAGGPAPGAMRPFRGSPRTSEATVEPVRESAGDPADQ